MNKLNEKAIELVTKLPKLTKSITFSRITLDFYRNNAVMFKLDGEALDWFFAKAACKKGSIDTRTARRTAIRERKTEGKCLIEAVYEKDGLTLKQHFEIEENKRYFTTYVTLECEGVTESNYLAPLDFPYPAPFSKELFLSLEERMLLVPYDNDMWVHYDTTPLRPGRTSYDLTAIYDDHSLNGLIIGALDFDTWKNGIICSSYDARCFTAVSGIADPGTHDTLEHGYISGKEVSSSRFVCGFYDDIREGLEEYGKLVINPDGVYHWNHGVPFGWNSYSALTLHTTVDHLRETADFIYDKLPAFRAEDGVTYINFDAVFGIRKKDIRKLVSDLHKRGQKAGWYMNPLSHLKIQDHVPLRGSKFKFRKDIVQKMPDGSDYPPIDGKYPIDITIPEAELDLRLALREFVDMGFDYLKIDFMSHGALEGPRYNPEVKTGRQALTIYYRIIKEELDPGKIGRDVFISSSIDPLFPCGYSHSRRASCDAFGHHEDVKYVLNALNYGWWTNGTLYQYNDPDHTVLYYSMVDGRNATEVNEARSRYNASAISGTVMLLSDNFGPEGDEDIIKQSRKRALQFADNKEINELIRLGKAFRPLTMKDTANVYCLNDRNDYVAVFNFENKEDEFVIEPEKIGFKKEGSLLNLNDGNKKKYKDKINIKLDAYDSVIMKLL